MQRNAPRTKGFCRKKFQRKSAQQTIDTLGVAFRPDVLDVDLYESEIAIAQELITDVSRLLTENPLGKSERLVLICDDIALQITSNEGFTQVVFSTRAPRDKECFDRLFTSAESDEKLLEYLRSNTKTSSAQVYTFNSNGLETKRVNVFDTYALFDIDFYRKLAKIYEQGMAISNGIASDGNNAFAFAYYEPNADIAKSQRVEFHRDKTQGSDTLSRSFSLSGTVCAFVGVDESSLVEVVRSPGDELTMNYLDRGFDVRAPIHNFYNPNNHPVLNIVVDEHGLDGLQFLNTIGVFAPVQRDLLQI
ncbi:MAG: hypothetical protein U0R17_00755 [Acidimicrobiia bacterium]